MIFAGSLFAFYYFDQYPIIYRVLGLIGVVLLDFAILFNTEKIKNLRVFTYDARVELKKVVWSTKAEVIQTTIIDKSNIRYFGILFIKSNVSKNVIFIFKGIQNFD